MRTRRRWFFVSVILFLVVVGCLYGVGTALSRARLRLAEAMFTAVQGEKIMKLGAGVELARTSANYVGVTDEEGLDLVQDGNVQRIGATNRFFAGIAVYEPPAPKPRETKFFVIEKGTVPLKVLVMSSAEFTQLQQSEPELQNINLVSVHAVLDGEVPWP
jgi:hypothetical protein